MSQPNKGKKQAEKFEASHETLELVGKLCSQIEAVADPRQRGYVISRLTTLYGTPVKQEIKAQNPTKQPTTSGPVGWKDKWHKTNEFIVWDNAKKSKEKLPQESFQALQDAAFRKRLEINPDFKPKSKSLGKATERPASPQRGETGAEGNEQPRKIRAASRPNTPAQNAPVRSAAPPLATVRETPTVEMAASTI